MPEKPPKTGEVTWVANGVRRLLAPNPSPMTFWGTNTYLVGDDAVAIIDPGPDDPDHLAAIVRALAGRTCAGVFVTHPHLDHSLAAPDLAARLGVPTYGYGPPGAGRSDVMQALARQGLTGGGEGVDAAFVPDRELRDGDRIALGPHWITAVETPGHFTGHLSFVWGDTVLCGDTVMGWASTLISPPDGDLAAFLLSCARLKSLNARCLLPGHGPSIDDPTARIDWQVHHRARRTEQILSTLARGPATIEDLTRTIYTDTPVTLLPAAGRNVFAHLIDLAGQGRVEPAPDLAPSATYRLTDKSV